MSRFDLLIVGAGPAGMAAAGTARELGLGVCVVDDQPSPGGQIWRGVETVAAGPRGAALGKAYCDGAARTAAFRASGAVYEPNAQLWQIEPGFRAFVTRAGKAFTIEADAVILATGAQERPVPFTGWTLPGVLTVGAAQILFKTSGQIPAKPVWIAGCGPLPLLFMSQLLAAGGKIAGFLDTRPSGQLKRALPHLKAGLQALPDLLKGIAWLADFRRSGVPIVRHVSDLSAMGDGRLESIRYRTESGATATIPAEVLLVHEGVVPSIHAPLSLNCAMAWSDVQECFAPVLDGWGETTEQRIFVAGDGAGIAGAGAAEPRGSLAALGVALRLGRIDPGAAEARAQVHRRALSRALALRPFLDALYRPRRSIFTPPDETIVCRCEEVTAGDIRGIAKVGRPGANQTKAFTRAGMGPCQGRQCGYTVTQLLAAAEGRSPEDVGYYRIRPPLKPVTLGELATLERKSQG